MRIVYPAMAFSESNNAIGATKWLLFLALMSSSWPSLSQAFQPQQVRSRPSAAAVTPIDDCNWLCSGLRREQGLIDSSRSTPSRHPWSSSIRCRSDLAAAESSSQEEESTATSDDDATSERSLFARRAIRLAYMAAHGMSRWGASENQRIQAVAKEIVLTNSVKDLPAAMVLEGFETAQPLVAVTPPDPAVVVAAAPTPTTVVPVVGSTTAPPPTPVIPTPPAVVVAAAPTKTTVAGSTTAPPPAQVIPTPPTVVVAAAPTPTTVVGSTTAPPPAPLIPTPSTVVVAAPAPVVGSTTAPPLAVVTPPVPTVVVAAPSPAPVVGSTTKSVASPIISGKKLKTAIDVLAALPRQRESPRKQVPRKVSQPSAPPTSPTVATTKQPIRLPRQWAALKELTATKDASTPPTSTTMATAPVKTPAAPFFGKFVPSFSAPAVQKPTEGKPKTSPAAAPAQEVASTTLAHAATVNTTAQSGAVSTASATVPIPATPKPAPVREVSSKGRAEVAAAATSVQSETASTASTTVPVAPAPKPEVASAAAPKPAVVANMAPIATESDAAAAPQKLVEEELTTSPATDAVPPQKVTSLVSAPNASLPTNLEDEVITGVSTVPDPAAPETMSVLNPTAAVKQPSLYQARTLQVAARDQAGKSRWGSPENLRANLVAIALSSPDKNASTSGDAVVWKGTSPAAPEGISISTIPQQATSTKGDVETGTTPATPEKIPIATFSRQAVSTKSSWSTSRTLGETSFPIRTALPQRKPQPRLAGINAALQSTASTSRVAPAASTTAGAGGTSNTMGTRRLFATAPATIASPTVRSGGMATNTIGTRRVVAEGPSTIGSVSSARRVVAEGPGSGIIRATRVAATGPATGGAGSGIIRATSVVPTGPTVVGSESSTIRRPPPQIQPNSRWARTSTPLPNSSTPPRLNIATKAAAPLSPQGVPKATRTNTPWTQVGTVTRTSTPEPRLAAVTGASGGIIRRRQINISGDATASSSIPVRTATLAGTELVSKAPSVSSDSLISETTEAAEVTISGTVPSISDGTETKESRVTEIEAPAITETEVRALFDLWNNALATLNSTVVAQRYAADPVLLPTVSDTPRTDFVSIREYFDSFLEFKPQGVILEGKIQRGPGWAQDAGIYEFTMGATGVKVKARYSFVYVYEEGLWKIASQHSSQMPEYGKSKTISEEECRGLFKLWNNALATLDPDAVAKRYSSSAVLLPTISDIPRTDYASIKDYFVTFLKLKPQGVILESFVTLGNNWCEDVGIYEFTMGATGDNVRARYSFVYVNELDEWKIAHHHSSAMPESIEGKKELTEPEVRNLFTLWNDALATLDSAKVASRYAKNSVLLPTVSDVPRTDYESKRDYFDSFLQKKPQGKILESYVEVGNGWCKDVGIYEFTMGTTGDKVRERYSFIYVFEDGQWLISHHHSSVMPEGILAPAMTEQEKEVRGLFDLWNNALATLDSTTVANRYAAQPILLATVSDTPRTDFAGIKDYFDSFLKFKPQGVIIEGKVTVGLDWAQDAGIYEFTMGATGSKVIARYSFVYVVEDGEWKISHHHSSTMPESGKTIITAAECKSLFNLWNAALATLDSDLVARRYAANAVLLPTVSDVPRTDYGSIKAYFDDFLKLKPQGKILESFVTIGNNWCKDVGVYEFTMATTGNKVKARYSFVYVQQDGEWRISHHHSSAMPEARNSTNLSEQEVKSLFNVWNDALATLDSDKVASRYAKISVLLPTVSDVPRTDYASKKDYFESFLQKKPQGKVLESYVEVGDGWCKDVGIYEFTMGTTGEKVKGRYSFIYVFEDGEWKISHHHSSIMPQSVL